MNEGYQILAQSLSSEQRKALQLVKGADRLGTRPRIQEEACVILRELGLIQVSAWDEREFLKLTQKGRKVAEFV